MTWPSQRHPSCSRWGLRCTQPVFYTAAPYGGWNLPSPAWPMSMTNSASPMLHPVVVSGCSSSFSWCGGEVSCPVAHVISLRWLMVHPLASLPGSPTGTQHERLDHLCPQRTLPGRWDLVPRPVPAAGSSHASSMRRNSRGQPGRGPGVLLGQRTVLRSQLLLRPPCQVPGP